MKLDKKINTTTGIMCYMYLYEADPVLDVPEALLIGDIIHNDEGIGTSQVDSSGRVEPENGNRDEETRTGTRMWRQEQEPGHGDKNRNQHSVESWKWLIISNVQLHIVSTTTKAKAYNS